MLCVCRYVLCATVYLSLSFILHKNNVSIAWLSKSREHPTYLWHPSRYFICVRHCQSLLCPLTIFIYYVRHHVFYLRHNYNFQMISVLNPVPWFSQYWHFCLNQNAPHLGREWCPLVYLSSFWIVILVMALCNNSQSSSQSDSVLIQYSLFLTHP